MENLKLDTLNPAQLRAVKHDPDIPLQAIAGPGSGKTKVLTSRIAYLILHHGISPSAICAVTFTNKAANEMRDRLTKLIGSQRTGEVKLGTFHALCALFLRKYARHVGLEDNFTVCDADESKKVISALLKPHRNLLDSRDITLKDGTVLSIISKAKAKGQSSADFASDVQARYPSATTSAAPAFDTISRTIDEVVADIYIDYEKALRSSNSLDFDDLLLYGVKLFTYHHRAVEWCQHILVDEFQDTNTTQYELMKALAIARCVTVVGDPDQSIYGWRSAEVGNLSRMQRDYPGTQQILLEQNYRSTGAILKASERIVAQDKTRIQRSLTASHPRGSIPVLRAFDSEHAEAAFMAQEIKRVVAYTGGMLKYGDFAVLLRFNALSRSIESALQKEGIPSRVLAGHKFFERLEIKDLLAYLQLVDNPHFTPAFSRAVNVPARGIGEKTLKEILNRAQKSNTTPVNLVERICDGKVPDIKPPVKKKLASFVAAMRLLQQQALEGSSPADLINKLVDVVQYEEHLKKTQSDWESRWENVQELVTFASDVHAELDDTIDVNEDERDPEYHDQEEEKKETPLRLFLQASMLSSEGDKSNPEDDREKVTISTCHAAKGLEWPVVMVPAVEQGTFPFYRTDDVEEERRLLYVACTRAQAFLYLSHVTQRKVGGESKKKDLSSFVTAATKDDSTIFSMNVPIIDAGERRVTATVLDRREPDAEVLNSHITAFVASTSPKQQAYNPAFKTPLAAAEFVSSSKLLQGSNSMQPQITQRPKPLSAAKPAPHNMLPAVRPRSADVNIETKPVSFVKPPASVPVSAAKTAVASSVAPNVLPAQRSAMPAAVSLMPTAGVKRRLGMGSRTGGGYANKKFKAPGS